MQFSVRPDPSRQPFDFSLLLLIGLRLCSLFECTTPSRSFRTIRSAASAMGDIPEQRPNRRLVLCFDGTGNSFQGTESDTNIVKLYGLMDRRDPQQFHYYQRLYPQLC